MRAAVTKVLQLFLPAAIVLVSAVLCQQIIANSLANQRDKSDAAELNHVKHGLFSVNAWKPQITAILADEIGKLSLSEANELELRQQIEARLNALIDQVDKQVRRGNKGSAKGWVKQTFIDLFVSLKDIKKGIPQYADTIIHEMGKKKTLDQVKAALITQLDLYASQSFDTQDTSAMSRILLRTGTRDLPTARLDLERAIAARNDLVVREAILLIVLAAGLFAWSARGGQPLSRVRYAALVLSLVLLLLAGVTTPMIDMEAKITRMSFQLMGHPVHFENQVLYFQSKSILDVFWLMITHKDLQMKLVGVLMIAFSVVFPLLKIGSTVAYYLDFHRARENPLVRFFVLKSGKWSMADVMVVAIFMAYIGFNGIITSQFGQLGPPGPDLELLTTNGTSLQPGYYLFVTYTLLALFLSGLLTREPRT